MEGALSTAESSNWVFPDPCETSSVRRKIAVHSFVLKGIPMLKVVEHCAAGQVFFVLIPADSSRGWSTFVRKVREFMGFGPSKSLVTAERSFASVVTGSSFPLTGKCVMSSLEGENVLLVEEEGVHARCEFLSKCLVLRFAGHSPIRWNEFRPWMSKAWGIPADSAFHPIGDDLWMLPVSTKAIATRIMALKRWKFSTWNIFMDFWTEAAGRSHCLEVSNEAWVVARGIPLHLRSMDLFRQIGKVCGGFVMAEDGVSLSMIRIKIRRGSLIPDEIPVCCGEVVFPVRIEVEAPSSISPHGPKSSFLKRWKSKGKEVVLNSSSPGMEALIGSTPSSSGKSDDEDKFGTAEVTAGSFGQNGVGVRLVASGSMGEKGITEDVQLPGDMHFEVGAEHVVPVVAFCSNKDTAVVDLAQDPSILLEKENGKLKVSGLAFCSNKDTAVVDLAKDPSILLEKENGKLEVSGLGQKAIWTFGPSMDSHNQQDMSSDFHKSGTSDVSVSHEGLRAQTEDPELDFASRSVSTKFGSQADAQVRVELKAMSIPQFESPTKGFDDLEEGERFREQEVGLKVQKVAVAIGLELDGSRMQGERAAAKVCKEVLKRKPRKTPASKLEREHKRLGITDDHISSTPLPPRRDRSVPPIDLHDKF
ncbi:hypothetical protein LINPERHAP1_LOCUS11988 [Linum perenne]